MARIRSIKIGFFQNEELAALSAHHRLMFAGLWLLADRDGRLEDRPKRIDAELFPYEHPDAAGLLQDLAASGFIRRYSAAGRRFIQVLGFSKHQRPHPKEPPSVIPPCKETAEPCNSTAEPCKKTAPPGGLGDLGLGDLGNGDQEQRVPAPPSHKLLVKLAHTVLDDIELGHLPDAEAVAEVKTRAARAQVGYGDHDEVHKAIRSAEVQRARRRA